MRFRHALRLVLLLVHFILFFGASHRPPLHSLSSCFCPLCLPSPTLPFTQYVTTAYVLTHGSHKLALPCLLRGGPPQSATSPVGSRFEVSLFALYEAVRAIMISRKAAADTGSPAQQQPPREADPAGAGATSSPPVTVFDGHFKCPEKDDFFLAAAAIGFPLEYYAARAAYLRSVQALDPFPGGTGGAVADRGRDAREAATATSAAATTASASGPAGGALCSGVLSDMADRVALLDCDIGLAALGSHPLIAIAPCGTLVHAQRVARSVLAGATTGPSVPLPLVSEQVSHELASHPHVKAMAAAQLRGMHPLEAIWLRLIAPIARVWESKIVSATSIQTKSDIIVLLRRHGIAAFNKGLPPGVLTYLQSCLTPAHSPSGVAASSTSTALSTATAASSFPAPATSDKLEFGDNASPSSSFSSTSSLASSSSSSYSSLSFAAASALSLKPASPGASMASSISQQQLQQQRSQLHGATPGWASALPGLPRPIAHALQLQRVPLPDFVAPDVASRNTDEYCDKLCDIVSGHSATQSPLGLWNPQTATAVAADKAQDRKQRESQHLQQDQEDASPSSAADTAAAAATAQLAWKTGIKLFDHAGPLATTPAMVYISYNSARISETALGGISPLDSRRTASGKTRLRSATRILGAAAGASAAGAAGAAGGTAASAALGDANKAEQEQEVYEMRQLMGTLKQEYVASLHSQSTQYVACCPANPPFMHVSPPFSFSSPFPYLLPACSVRDIDFERLTCRNCGGGDHDDRMLLCDACDCGFHMYCTSPPLKAVPDGSTFPIFL